MKYDKKLIAELQDRITQYQAELHRKKEEILFYQREMKVYDERFARQVQINGKNQQIINHYKSRYDGVESDSEIVSLRQQNQALEKQLCEARNSSNFYTHAYQNEKVERRHAEDSLRSEF